MSSIEANTIFSRAATINFNSNINLISGKTLTVTGTGTTTLNGLLAANLGLTVVGTSTLAATNISGVTTISATTSVPSTSATPAGALNVAGALALTGGSGQAVIMINGGNYGPPNTTSRTIGTRIVLNPTSFPGSCDYSIGITTSPGIGIWYGTNQLSDHHYFYNNTTLTLDITNASTTFGSNNIVSITNSTASTSSSTGAFLVSGGISSSNTTNSVNSTNGGTFTTAGGAAIAKDLYIGGVLYLPANVTQQIVLNTNSTVFSDGVSTASTLKLTSFGGSGIFIASGGAVTINNTTGIPSAAGSNTATGALSVNGSIAMTNSGTNFANTIMWTPGNNAEPTLITPFARSIGSKLILWANNQNTNSTDYAIGVGSSSIWYQADFTGFHNWYIGRSLIVKLSDSNFFLGTSNAAAVKFTPIKSVTQTTSPVTGGNSTGFTTDGIAGVLRIDVNGLTVGNISTFTMNNSLITTTSTVLLSTGHDSFHPAGVPASGSIPILIRNVGTSTGSAGGINIYFFIIS